MKRFHLLAVPLGSFAFTTAINTIRGPWLLAFLICKASFCLYLFLTGRVRNIKVNEMYINPWITAFRCLFQFQDVYSSTLLPFLWSKEVFWHKIWRGDWTKRPFALTSECSQLCLESLSSKPFYFQCSVLIRNHHHNSVIPCRSKRGIHTRQN